MALAAVVADMRRASQLVDEADGPADYHQRLIALALIARQYLRKADELAALPAPQPERMFPIQRGPAIPWSVIAPYDQQCRHNHGGQGLERMAERGGLGVTEAIDVLLCLRWGTTELSPPEAIERLLDIVADRKRCASMRALPAPQETARHEQALQRLLDVVNAARYRPILTEVGLQRTYGSPTDQYGWPMSCDCCANIAEAALQYVVSLEKNKG